MFFTLNYSHSMSDYFLVEQSVSELLNSVAIDSLPSIFFKEFIFDFNPTNSSTTYPSDSSFILPITFLLA